MNRLLASEAPIVSVVGPAGYGKTTLLDQWLASTRLSSSWVTLDERDNDVGVLAGYLAAALHAIEPIEPRALRALAAPRTIDPAVVADRLAMVISAMRTPFAMVIDQVEVIENQRCRDVLGELALSLPAGSRLGFGSRSEPPITVARLRSQGRLLDVTFDDLAMVESEANDLLTAAGVDVEPELLHELLLLTEGWPAGLYLAALSFRAGGDPAAKRGPFRGDHRFVADYLRSEFLVHLPRETVVFLTRTSVLDELSGPLCDAVVGTSGAQQMLEALAASNLLVIPLDQHGHWYRYHTLLRGFLRAELDRKEPDFVSRLHDRAATWFESNDRAGLAIEHAQAAGDVERASRLFARTAQLASGAGQIDSRASLAELVRRPGSRRPDPTPRRAGRARRGDAGPLRQR